MGGLEWNMACSISDCERPPYARGWCGAHYKRWLRWGDPHGKYAMKGDHLAWVQSVVQRGDTLRCGEADWPFATVAHFGYGKLHYNGRPIRAHRLVLSLVTGRWPDPKQEWALHSCDRPICCAPGCLRWGTHEDNAEDRTGRGRQVKGERVNTARLDVDKVRQIRRQYAEGGVTQLMLADQYGVKESSVWSVIHRQSWRHVT